MKTLLNILKWLAIVLLVAVAGLKLSGNGFLLKGLWATYLHGHVTASISDARFFDTRTVAAGTPQPWPLAPDHNKATLSPALRKSLEDTRTVAFLIVKDGQLQYEEYWDGYTDTSHTNSFSMAKSITTMLVQCAIQDGLIQGWDQPAMDFLPELKGEFAPELTLRHLCTMTAGLDFNEHYSNPFDITAKLYYGPDVEHLLMENVPVVRRPGAFEYQSGATQLLGLALMKAVGRPLADYAADRLWKPLGAEYDAQWHLDNDNGKELAFCCFNSNARDFARFGQLLLHNGNWKGTQLLDSSFVAAATVGHAVPYYGHSFWIDDAHGTHVFYQRGILGQYIIVIPERNMVVVRLGHSKQPNVDNHPEDFGIIISEVLVM